MLDHLSGEMRDSVSQQDNPFQNPRETGLGADFKDSSLQALPSHNAGPQLPPSYCSPGSIDEGASGSNYPILESGMHPPMNQNISHASAILPLESQSSGISSSVYLSLILAKTVRSL